MASNIDPATMMLMETNLGILGPNKYTQFPNGISWPSSYAGSPTNAMGSPIQGGSSYVNALANPGKVTTPGGYDNSSQLQPSVLDTFLNANQGGTGAGNYSNKGFFDTLNSLRSGGGGSAGGQSAAQLAQSEVDARNAQQPQAAPAAAPMGTTINTTPAAATSTTPAGYGISPQLDQIAGWNALINPEMAARGDVYGDPYLNMITNNGTWSGGNGSGGGGALAQTGANTIGHPYQGVVSMQPQDLKKLSWGGNSGGQPGSTGSGIGY